MAIIPNSIMIYPSVSCSAIVGEEASSCCRWELIQGPTARQGAERDFEHSVLSGTSSSKAFPQGSGSYAEKEVKRL